MHQQKGYAVLLMLVVLLSGGFALSMPLLPATPTDPLSRVMSSARVVQSARQSLLVYASLYPFLYGPRGAGPGHLPCPDTGGSEGPDPPCGKFIQAAGHLPRHVSLAAHRYPLQTAPSPRYDYRVSSRLINNPVNRVVNDKVLLALGESTPYVLWIESQNTELQQSSGGSKATLSARAMIPGVSKSVAAWLSARIEAPSAIACDEAGMPLRTPRLRLQEFLRQVVDELGTADASLSACSDSIDIELWLENQQIEGVPALSHWFIRNRWHEQVLLSGDGLSVAGEEVIFR